MTEQQKLYLYWTAFFFPLKGSNFSFKSLVIKVSVSMSAVEIKTRRCHTSYKTTDEGVTYAKEIGEQLQGLGRNIVNIPPVVGWHASRPLLWFPVVQEVGQQRGG